MEYQLVPMDRSHLTGVAELERPVLLYTLE